MTWKAVLNLVLGLLQLGKREGYFEKTGAPDPKQKPKPKL